MKKAAVFNDISGFGKCSLTAAIPVLSVMGVQCCPIPSAVLTAQTGYDYYKVTDLTAMIPDFTEAWKKNKASFDGIYSGFMTGKEQVNLFLDFLKEFNKDDTFLLVDPVMGDDGETYSIYSQDLLDGMKALTKQANLITPNLTEACLLAGLDAKDIHSFSDTDELLGFSENIAVKLRAQADCEQDVVITGIKPVGNSSSFIYNLAVTDNGSFKQRSHFFDRSFSGTGDLFASVLCGCRINGMSTEDAIGLASSFIYHSIADTVNDDTADVEGVNFEKFLGELIPFKKNP